jgi:hypothetical protein
MSRVQLFADADSSFFQFPVYIVIYLLTKQVIKGNHPEKENKDGDRQQIERYFC